MHVDVPEGAIQGVPGTYVVKYKQTVSWLDWVSRNELIRTFKGFGAKLRQFVKSKKYPGNNNSNSNSSGSSNSSRRHRRR